MAKLEKADQAFCFTSGMAALAAVTHLLKSGIVMFFAVPYFSCSCHGILYAFVNIIICQTYDSQDKK